MDWGSVCMANGTHREIRRNPRRGVAERTAETEMTDRYEEERRKEEERMGKGGNGTVLV